MQKKLQQILTELTVISDVRFALYRTPEEYVAGTLPEDACDPVQVAQFFAQAAHAEPVLTGEGDAYMAFPVRAVNETQLLVAEGASADVSLSGRMAAHTVQVFFDACKTKGCAACAVSV